MLTSYNNILIIPNDFFLNFLHSSNYEESDCHAFLYVYTEFKKFVTKHEYDTSFDLFSSVCLIMSCFYDSIVQQDT